MSLVSISGGATGTGTFTVLAPSTNTNRTLTLPDATGTVLDSTGGTTQTALTVTNGASIQGLTVGRGAGAGSTNTVVGASALIANTTGYGNTSIGRSALSSNTTGNNNTAVGPTNAVDVGAALAANTTGSANIAIGGGALNANTTASNNTAVGYQAGLAITTGTFNTAVGSGAGRSSTTSGNNTLIGGDAGAALTGGSNTFIGAGVGQLVTTGTKNTIIGGYNGNQGGLDIRTASNHIVLSDGDGNPRGIFDNTGSFLIGKTSASIATAGVELRQTDAPISTFNGVCLYINRITTDGTLIEFRQDNAAEGSISVSGTTVSYNGGHLSRWAQTTTAKDESLVKGTVLSNLDEMNVYVNTETGDTTDNEQLNKVKVSGVEGDVNVAGVFVNWSYDEQHSVDEINMAMTGDMIIRIAQGVTVARGDLLMSAGDGTAKPQGDDIVRSKTVAKVTSTHVTCTYADGSFCVPCVLMAC